MSNFDTTAQEFDNEEDAGPVLSFYDWPEKGLLWLVNTTVFWPRGFALGITGTGDAGSGTIDSVIGYSIHGDGSSPISASNDELAQKRHDAVEALFAELRAKN